ncbi:MAG: efflux RND transporter permease subunit, partial [Burkholderiales bacterium]|nr:efflux RND transporter permease subunit [Burkholderiales bacterium]
MNFSQWMQAHRRSILFVLTLLAIGGAIMAFKLPTSLFPNVDFPRVLITLDAGDRPAEQMSMLVTTPVEEAVRRVPGVKDVHSTSSRGNAEVSVNFDWGLDMPRAALETSAAIAQILPTLPAGTQMTVQRMDPTKFPIIAYSLTSKTQSLSALYELAQYQLRPVLSAVPGVAQVQVGGGAKEEYRVTVDPVRLSAYKLSLADVSRMVASNNVISAAGRLEDHYKLYLVIANTALKSLEDIRKTVISSGPGGIVHLGDVAQIDRNTEPQWVRVTADGQDAVLLNIYQQPGSNSVAIARDIRAKLTQFGPRLPKDVRLANWYDQSELVTESAVSVGEAILIGVLLAACVLFAFLRNWKITAIAMALVPVVLAATIVPLNALNMGFNIMTLGGMAAAVGLVIDDAIVMIEHIIRRLREGGSAAFHGKVMSAALEFTRPLAGSSAATLVIFIPLAFLDGVTGAFFKALSITMASALLISFLITWLAVPILCDHWLTSRDAEHEEGGRLTDWFHRHYGRLMQLLLGKPWWLLVGILPLAVA